MTSKDITRDDVLAALEEFDRLDGDAMLRQYGGGRSRRYWICFNGRHYDQKLIYRAVHELSGRGRLPSTDIDAGRTRRRLETLGFRIVDRESADGGASVASS